MKKILFWALLVRLFFIFGPYHPDLSNHLDWGIKFWEYGPKEFYEQSIWGVSWPNQPPGTIYLWGAMSKLKDGIFGFFWQLNLRFPLFPSGFIFFLEKNLHPALVKLPSVLAELGIGWLIYLMVRKNRGEKPAAKAALLFLFNPVIIYNSAIWGQTDGLINFFGLLAVYLLLNKKPIWGVLAYAVSFYFKTSLVIFAPVIIWLLFWKKYSVRTLFLSFILPVLFIFVATLPFVSHNPVWKWLADLYRVRVFGHQGNMLSGNAFNLWTLIFGIDLARTDGSRWLFFNFRQWGQLLFVLAVFPTFLRLFFLKKENEKVFFSLALIAFAAFLFLTNMHERYLYPIFPYLAILVGLKKVRPFYYWLISLVHFLNLYNLWFYPLVPVLKTVLIFQNFLICRALSLVAILLFFALYVFFFRQKNDKITENEE